MDLVLLMGLHAAGKSTFLTHRFPAPKSVITLDPYKPAAKGAKVTAKDVLKELEAALAKHGEVILDGVNPTRQERAAYIQAAKQAGYRVAGYYLSSDLKDCISRNAARKPAERVPELFLKSTIKKFERPDWDEGYAELYFVFIDRRGRFVMREYRNP